MTRDGRGAVDRRPRTREPAGEAPPHGAVVAVLAEELQQPMDKDELKQALAELHLSQGALARIFKLLGDTAAPLTIRRRVERWAQGGSPVPGEAAAFVNLLRRFPAVLQELAAAVAVPPRAAKEKQPG